MSLVPFLKWPGGKRWFVAHHAQVFPSTYGRYFEPFLGGASVFFHLQPNRAVLSDCNAELIDVYRAIARRRRQVEALLSEHHNAHGYRYYYRIRGTIPADLAARAARTLYLNRTCFNGIYRVNLSGTFNVPKGEKSTVLLDTDDFRAAASVLRRAEIVCNDFEPMINRARGGDLVFADPPYTVRHNNNGFVKYNETLFSWTDQQRLAKALMRAAVRGVKVVLTNADHDEVRALYPQRTFSARVVERYSSISCTTSSRRSYRELVIRANCD